MTEPAGQDQAAARREAEIAALEAAIVAAVTATLAARLAAITRPLRGAFRRWAAKDPGRWMLERLRVANALRAVRPDVARQVERLLPRAAQLGARHAGGRLPHGHAPAADPLVREVLDSVDQAVHRKLALAADAVTGRVDTEAQLDAALTRVDAVRSEAASGTGDVVARSVAGGTKATAASTGRRTVVWTERSACLSCKSMAGATPSEDGLFRPVRIFAPRLVPWLRDGVTGPPFHRSCRCHLQVETPGIADALRREAEREVARGESAYDSLPARLKAVDRLLAGKTSRIPKTVRERAARDRARGQFSQRDKLARKAG